jgi:transcriptional antiterminator RfaH
LLKAEENPPIIWTADFEKSGAEDILWPVGESITEFAGPWWVAHTKSRNEKALAQDLIRKSVSYFLPMSWKAKNIRGRKFRSLIPLFSGYLFFCGGENQRLETLRTNRVANIIEVKDQDKFLGELVQIEKALRAGAPLVPHKYIKKGQLCRIIAGPLIGLKGIVVTVKGSTRLVLQIDMLGQAASVEVDIDMIEPVD